MTYPHHILLFLLMIFLSTFMVESLVPKNQTFKFVNQGEYAEYIVEYDGNYRIVIAPDDGQVFSHPFRLCFYNTTPEAHVLAIRGGVPNDEDLMRWLWDANRNDPVRTNSSLTFSQDGNLVLADADGRIAWQTNTANKGVRGMKMLPNGNLVLHDRKGKFIWQSFDYPTDTLSVGQTLSLTGRSRLVSRTSDIDSSDGKYSLVIDSKGLTMYLNNSGKLLQYGGWGSGGPQIRAVKFDSVLSAESVSAYEFTWIFTQDPDSPPPPATRHLLQSRPVDNSNGLIIKKVNYDTTLSFIRLDSDGNLRAYTYFRNVTYSKWDETYAFFGRGGSVRECGLPSKCGSFGYCDNRMCVACPSRKGLLGWSENCKPPPVPPCKIGGNVTVNYYKIAGVEHFLSPYEEGEGPMKVNECREKCTKDCSCVGFFYKDSKCLQVPILGTLIRDVNSSHVGFVKYLK